MSAAHTPGPWLALPPCRPGRPRLIAPTCHGGDISNVALVYAPDKDDATGRANARLIAAAPELLEALRDIVEAVDPAVGGLTLEDWAAGPVAAARAAIATATNEEPTT